MEFITGTAAFGMLVFYDYQKCRNVRQNRTAGNPWFILGMAVLLGSFAAEAAGNQMARGVQLVCGIGVLAAGIVFYGAVLGVASGKQG